MEESKRFYETVWAKHEEAKAKELAELRAKFPRSGILIAERRHTKKQAGLHLSRERQRCSRNSANHIWNAPSKTASQANTSLISMIDVNRRSC